MTPNNRDFGLCPRCRESYPVLTDDRKTEPYKITVKCESCGYRIFGHYSSGGSWTTLERLRAQWRGEQ